METEHRKAVLKMIRTDEHDQDCVGVYERRRTVNGVGVRIMDYRARCLQCEAEVLGELEHRIDGRNYCGSCLSAPEPEHLSRSTLVTPPRMS